jgi:hypothetical protein
MQATEAIDIGSRREVFWDEFLIDATATTAQLKLHPPQSREVVLTHDAPWEGDGCDFHNIVRDDDLYRLYYLGWEMLNPEVTGHSTGNIVVAYAESRDGLTWHKPSLGLREWEGATANNIILDRSDIRFDNFYVFKDPNPACPDAERYKGVALEGGTGVLICFTSADGIRFEKGWPITDRGKFDTLNIAFWDRHSERYFCYVRDFHRADGSDFAADERHSGGVRDVRWLTSTDFKNWSAPVRLDFGDAPDLPLYTNVTQPYYRADHVFVGFPSRYIERQSWTPNYDALPGAEHRQKLVDIRPRYGLTVTDCLFMCSRDGLHWRRWDEAFMRPGPERDANWVYGDCYPAVGLIETPSHLPAAAPELSMYAFDNHWSMRPAELRRYVLRVDGFVSYSAPYAGARVVSRPFIFAGDQLSINFATSAAGSVRITLASAAGERRSCELFGDSIDRVVPFAEGDLAPLAGQPTTLTIEMCDADVYSFRFGRRNAATT